MRELLLILLGCIIGYLFIIWAVYMLVARARLAPAERKSLRIPLWLVVFILLIGLADSYKATKDLIAYARGDHFKSRVRAP